jgi:exo-1,4-beta-D-glucosaminidase
MPKTYSWQLPRTYYWLVREHRNWMFMIESASASVPPLESLVQFIPQLRDLPPNSGDDPTYPLDSTWAHYGANSYYEWFDRGLRLLYGEPRDVRDYAWKAHLVAYDQHRAFFEAVHHRMWDITSGFGEWKINSAFPDVQWQLYDWFLRPMPSLFAIRKACAPLAVQLDPMDDTVLVVSNLFEPLAGLQLQATVYDLDLKVLHQQHGVLDVAANSYAEAFAIPRPSSADQVPVYFVKLELRDAEGDLAADNFYWLSPRLDDYEVVYDGDMRQIPANKPVVVPRASPCFPELVAMAQASVECRAEVTAGSAVQVVVANPTDQLAFFLRLRLLSAADGAEVLPVFWEDNYFSLLPGESKTVAASLGTPPADKVVLEVEGWNVPTTRVEVK